MTDMTAQLAELKGANARLGQENERLAQENRTLKAQRDRRFNNLLFANESRELARRVVDTLARLEEDADPTTAVAVSSPITGGGDPSPIPGARTQRERGTLQRFQKSLGRLLADVEREWDNQAVGRKPLPRPKCNGCGGRGQVGDLFCGRCGTPYEALVEVK